jgi:hypothetical protein
MVKMMRPEAAMTALRACDQVTAGAAGISGRP